MKDEAKEEVSIVAEAKEVASLEELSKEKIPTSDLLEELNFDIQDLVSSLRTNWPSLACPSSDSTSFWQHEWDKHGTCSESVMDEHGYFQDSLNLKSRINLLQYLQSAGISPNNAFYTLTNIKSAIKTGTGHTPWIECNKDASGNYQLYQVYICIDHAGTTLIDCPVFPTGACGSSIKFPTF
ncbi:hypothetical protein LUZ62_052397 [Rhynchospora pubera]|uniref:Uncharacterized protein n=1 Tax=Rhynchospora pubera TaxID=906938 RepID=A0AAV8GCK5_9POAL|nr:hypothetical protein LUZ62_052397 [Rhynchospora pubera]